MLSNPEDLLGRTMGGYRLEATLGTGATGVVFYGRAADGSQAPVAIKLLVIPLNASAADRVRFEKRFRREAEMLQRLRHPRILRLLAFGEEAGCFYMVLPYLAGGTLAARMMTLREPLPLNLVAWYLNEIASALDYAHSQGVIHRDLKPGNMLLDTQGQLFLADFSIARLLDPTRTNLTQTGQVLGTLEYLSPEQAGGEDASLASDIYSLGVVVYELVTGRVPFQGKSFGEVFKKHTQEQPPPPRTLRPDLPEAAEAVILQALAKSPAERFSSAGAFAQAFALGLQGQWAPGVKLPGERTTPFIPPPTVNVPSGPPAAPETGRFITPPTVRVGAPQQPGRSAIPQAPVGGSVPPGVTAPDAPCPVALPRKSRAGLIALVVMLLVVVTGGGSIVLGVNHQGPLASLFPGVRSPALTSAVTVTPQPTLSATVTTPPTPKSPAGVITEFPLPTGTSGPVEITSGPDGNLWFTASFANQIGRISPSGIITKFSVLTPSSFPYGITSGPDGNLWFTELVGKIGRITPGGMITEFPTPTPSSNPLGITAGPDSALWFTERTGGHIGRITPAGVITEFPQPVTGPVGITLGPDGNLWFTERVGTTPFMQIGRITPSGQITEFPIDSGRDDPYGIAAGPDGNLWFTESSQHMIGRMTPSGNVTHFAIPTASAPYEITSGADGNLWFTAENSNQIGRVTPRGDFTLFPIPTSSSPPYGITSGPDGNLWFTEEKANQIGRITSGI